MYVLTVNCNRNNASERPLGRYDFTGVRRRFRAFTTLCVAGVFPEKKKRGAFGPPGAIQKKNEKHTHAPHKAHSYSFRQ